MAYSGLLQACGRGEYLLQVWVKNYGRIECAEHFPPVIFNECLVIAYALCRLSAATLRSIFFISPCNTLPGPSSTKLSAPSAIMFCIDCVQRTGAVSCFTRFCLMSSGFVRGFASTF